MCLFTGAGGTLGSAFCRLYADKYSIAAVYRRQPPPVPSQHQWLIDPLAPQVQISQNRDSIFAIHADLGEDRELERVVDLTLARFDRIDVLVNAAVHSCWAPAVDSGRLVKELAQQFSINTMVPLKLAVCIARKFWRDRDRENAQMNRSVINVSSIAGVYVYPNSGQSVYSASKAALNFLTFHLASEFAPFRVRVNATAPNAFPQIVSTEDAAKTIRSLDEGRMTGKVLILDSNGQCFYSPSLQK